MEWIPLYETMTDILEKRGARNVTPRTTSLKGSFPSCEVTIQMSLLPSNKFVLQSLSRFQISTGAALRGYDSE